MRRLVLGIPRVFTVGLVALIGVMTVAIRVVRWLGELLRRWTYGASTSSASIRQRRRRVIGLRYVWARRLRSLRSWRLALCATLPVARS